LRSASVSFAIIVLSFRYPVGCVILA